jgi:transposase InsO family protein
MRSPRNIVQLHYKKPFGQRTPRTEYGLYSTRWGLLRKTPLFEDKWARLRATAKEMKLSHDARKRLEWMIWYETFGMQNARATCRHFCIAPKVFYFWKKRFSETELKNLEDRSHRPHRARASTLNSIEIERIAELRRNYLFYSKFKLAILYRERYGAPIKCWKIEQVIRRFSLYPNIKKARRIAKMRRNAWKKKRITELQTKPRPGFLFCLDTVIRHFEGNKRYILTAVDRFSRLAYARMYATHSSAAAADFLQRLHLLMNGNLVHIQTDNGSEFHKHFEDAIKKLDLQHWWSRTKTPKDNAVCERFNRTLQEEFIGRGNGYPNPIDFNRKLAEWLIEYDFHRPHVALGYRRPIEIAAGGALPITPAHTLH